MVQRSSFQLLFWYEPLTAGISQGNPRLLCQFVYNLATASLVVEQRNEMALSKFQGAVFACNPLTEETLAVRGSLLRVPCLPQPSGVNAAFMEGTSSDSLRQR